MFVQSEEFIAAHGGRLNDISIFGQESNYTTWRLAKMNLAIRGIDARIEHGDTFHNDRHPDLKADYILANPPFNVSDWGGERLREDKRWQYGVPAVGNANVAWVQHKPRSKGSYIGSPPETAKKVKGRSVRLLHQAAAARAEMRTEFRPTRRR
jgi:type I restriction-modification system DNA methylase subunit